MDRLKVTELKAEAKRLGLKRYSNLRKAELIDVINQAHERERGRSRNLSPIFDEPVPEINSQTNKSSEKKIKNKVKEEKLKKKKI